MNTVDFFKAAGEVFDVTLQFIPVGVAGIGVEGRDFGADPVGFAKDVDRASACQNLCAERVFGAVADEQNEIFRAAEIVFK